MPRRIKTKNPVGNRKIILNKKFPARGKGAKQDLRFNVSLVFLIAMLSISAYLFLFSLTENGKAFRDKPDQAPKVATASPAGAVSPGKNQLLDDAALDFELTIPSQFGRWIYRVGSVQGLADDTLTNQFVKIYVAAKPAGNSASFDENYKDILTLRKFSTDEWDKLEKGCGKGNLIFCEGSGTKIDEKDGSVWAYTKGESCSKETKASCALIEKIIGSFQFK